MSAVEPDLLLHLTCACMGPWGLERALPHHHMGTLPACPLAYSMEGGGGEGMVTHRDNSLSVSIAT